jgi:hypothetical protein
MTKTTTTKVERAVALARNLRSTLLQLEEAPRDLVTSWASVASPRCSWLPPSRIPSP